MDTLKTKEEQNVVIWRLEQAQPIERREKARGPQGLLIRRVFTEGVVDVADVANELNELVVKRATKNAPRGILAQYLKAAFDNVSPASVLENQRNVEPKALRSRLSPCSTPRPDRCTYAQRRLTTQGSLSSPLPVPTPTDIVLRCACGQHRLYRYHEEASCPSLKALYPVERRTQPIWKWSWEEQLGERAVMSAATVVFGVDNEGVGYGLAVSGVRVLSPTDPEGTFNCLCAIRNHYFLACLQLLPYPHAVKVIRPLEACQHYPGGDAGRSEGEHV
ncbi:hypothetical protein HPB48_014343 [Haemaphysalis longicornis]|uniref:Uncharacterized protein n=1 Tax=Haemaphysalis longicornis TaxID=44386 RepID=A0A9J6G2F4_HAELO|nr:hypothetical protein HPB48_014343 [Haemaphysalis longicornis]